MKIAISSTYDSKYLFFLPIVSYTWKLIGCDVICLMPAPVSSEDHKKLEIVKQYMPNNCSIYHFICNAEQAATYSQCSRLYAASLCENDEDWFMMSDIDMIVFSSDYFMMEANEGFTVFGADLVPENQYPICYIKGKVKYWKEHVTKGLSYQECLDNLLGDIQCENMRGNYWAKDQEEIYNIVSKTSPTLIKRARPNTQFASIRLDRDDAYILDRLNPDILDYHINRPGYEDDKFAIIMSILEHYYPGKNEWIKKYKESWIQTN